MDRLDAMSILLNVVEAGSFSAASRKLRIPLPTVSRKVSELEAHLKAQVLVRSTRKLALTSAGVAYVAAVKRILEQVNDAEKAATGESASARGELVVTAPVAFGRLHVLPIVNAFLAEFTGINVRLILSDRNVHLIDDQVDLAVRIGALPDSGLVATRVGSVRRVVCGSPDYFAIRGKPMHPEDLSSHDAVTFDMMGPSDFWDFRSRDSKDVQLVPVRSRLAINTAEAAVDAAIAGVGVTRVLSYQVADALENGRLQIVLPEFEQDPIPISLVHAGQHILPARTRLFLEFLAKTLRGQFHDLKRQ